MGNSLAVRLPAALVEALGPKEGDMLVAGRRVFEAPDPPNWRCGAWQRVIAEREAITLELRVIRKTS
jgi:hypothetical protein